MPRSPAPPATRPPTPGLRFLTPDLARRLARRYGTPTYVYDEGTLRDQAARALAFPAPFGLTLRYAMKANPHRALLRLFDGLGLWIDASSGFEAERAIRAGVSPSKVLLTAQEVPADLPRLVRRGVRFAACSLHQLEAFGRAMPGRALTLRINPGVGSGHSAKTMVGGREYGFGIWHEHLGRARALIRRCGLTVDRLHCHIGTGGDQATWPLAAEVLLGMAEGLPEVAALNLGGGLRVGRMPGEPEADVRALGEPIAALLERFAATTGRRLRLEIEPGTFLTANAGSLVCRVADVADTGRDGHRFLKLDTGMTEILRPTLYGSQHPVVVLSRAHRRRAVVIGHCCESGDLLTPSPSAPDHPEPRHLPAASVGDLAVIEGVGAYCAGMAAAGYNSFPRAAEVLLRAWGRSELISRRGDLDAVMAHEA